MTILAIVLLIIFGIALLILEFLVLPGAIAGITGVGLMGGGIYMTYTNYGLEAGTITLLATLILSVIALYYALKSNTWNKVMLTSAIKSKAFDKEDTENTEGTEEQSIKPGDTGITVSRLNPIGKVFINDEYIEAKATHAYVEPSTDVEVVKVFPNQIVVKPKN